MIIIALALCNKINELILTNFSEKKSSNREKYPEIAALVDLVRESFPKAKVKAIRKLPQNVVEMRLTKAWKRKMELQSQANRGSV